MICAVYVCLLWSLCADHVHAWREWNYSVNYRGSYELWNEQWSRARSDDIGRAPRPRRGHSLVLAGDYLLMFGGRGNEAQLEHVPRTYNVERVGLCLL